MAPSCLLFGELAVGEGWKAAGKPEMDSVALRVGGGAGGKLLDAACWAGLLQG